MGDPGRPGVGGIGLGAVVANVTTGLWSVEIPGVFPLPYFTAITINATDSTSEFSPRPQVFMPIVAR